MRSSGLVGVLSVMIVIAFASLDLTLIAIFELGSTWMALVAGGLLPLVMVMFLVRSDFRPTGTDEISTPAASGESTR